MTADFEYRNRAGSLMLSIFALAGLTLLAAVIWTLAPAFALILLVPALVISFYQIVVSPVYGIRVTSDGWQVFSDAPDRTVPLADISHVQFSDKPGAPRCTLVLSDGAVLPLPDQALPADQMTLIREASARGLKIRQV